MRLFAGFRLSPRAEERLSALRLRLARPSDGLRWTSPDQWHITLCFFGEVDAAQVERVITKLGQFDGSQPLLRIERLGLFPQKGILHAAVELTDDLGALHANFTSHMGLEAGVGSSLPFHPHITLARSRGRLGVKTLEMLGRPALPVFGPATTWTAGHIHLYESISGPQGAAYRTVALEPLQP